MSALREVTGRELGRQAVVKKRGSAALARRRFKAPTNRPGFPKPKGGLWTSTYRDPETVSDWVRWLRDEQWGDYTLESSEVWIVERRPEARLLYIDNLDDLYRIVMHAGVVFDYGLGINGDDYKLPPKRIPDFELLAKTYDGIHLTEEGQWRTRLTDPDLYGWDCESTLWLRWALLKAEPLVLPVAA